MEELEPRFGLKKKELEKHTLFSKTIVVVQLLK